jgi:hypothetical protein
VRWGDWGGEMTQTLYAHMNKRNKKNSFYLMKPRYLGEMVIPMWE